MYQDKKKLISLLVWNFFLMFLWIGFITCLILQKTDTEKSNNQHVSNINPYGNGDIFYTLLLSMCIMFLPLLILQITLPSKIISIRWKSQWCSKYRKLWGLLALFCISFIGIFIFTIIGLCKLKNENKNSHNQTDQIEQIFVQKNPFKKPQNPFNNPNGPQNNYGRPDDFYND